MPRRLLHALLVCCSSVPIAIHAHHTYAEYDDAKTIEIEGTLVKVAWQNPHAHLQVQAPDASGRLVTFDIEGVGLNVMRRLSVPLEEFAVGDKVKVAGWPSKRSASRVFLTNLAEDGRELVTWRFAKPRWSTAASGFGADRTLFAGGTATNTASLFRVWTSDYDDPDAAPESLMTSWKRHKRRDWPLTEAAKRALAAWNPVVDTSTPGCKPKGMPQIMGQPFPMQFLEQGDTIVLRMEEYDTVRTIHMNAGAPGRGTPGTPLGYSRGRWEDQTLFVETTHVNERYLGGMGIPLGGAVRIFERFTPSADGSRLDLTLTVMDPDTFTEPVELKRSWVYRPGEKLMRFDCRFDSKK